MWIKDSKGEPSVTVTAFVIGFFIVNIKFLLAGMTIFTYKFPELTGAEYGTALGALGAIYVLRRSLGTKDN